MSRYKLFPKLAKNRISERNLEKLIEEMCKKSDSGGEDANIFAGFTYLGQMIAHDIVKSTNIKPKREINCAEMMLESVYGNKKFNDDNEIFNNGKFKFSKPEGEDDLEEFVEMDLFRKCGKVVIPDQRNDENYLISQMHLFWQKLHNTFYKSLKVENYCKTKTNNKFDIAKELVIKNFQQVVVEDFLYNILDIDVYHTYINKISDSSGDLFFYKKDQKMEEVPLEFSHAAFRFGHSMVRDEYLVNRRNKLSNSFNLSQLFNPKHKSIDVKKIVNWVDFFGLEELSLNTETAFRINDYIVNPMNNLPDPNQNNPIVKLNLMAGKDAELPSGYTILKHIQDNEKEIAKIFKLNVKDYECIELKSYDFLDIDEVPLWLYILLESKSNEDMRLGKLGSIIIAEVILKSILQATTSILTENSVYLSDVTSRLTTRSFDCPKNGNDLFKEIIDEFRRFKMFDLLQLVGQL